MSQARYNTLKFFRGQFGIPELITLEWCVICERTAEGEELRLGVALRGTRLCIDVAQRRLYSEIALSKFSRHILPAKRIAHKECHEYLCADGRSITRPKSFIEDIYYPTRYREGMDKETLL